MERKLPLVLCILDGWGIRKEKEYNAIALGKTPNYDRFINEYPNSVLDAAGVDVGLPEGQMGNSEVGHPNIGAGRVVKQTLPRINDAVKNDTLKNSKEFLNFVDNVKKASGAVNIFGLLSDGGIHSHINHIIYLAKSVSDNNLNVNLHMVTDGRDTPPKSAITYIDKLEEEIKDYPRIKIATIGGRYYGMDRIKGENWDRIEKAYDAAVLGEDSENTKIYDSAKDVVENSYSQDIADEFIVPAVIKGYDGMKDGDGFLIANFRADRIRKIAACMADPDFNEFNRKKVINISAFLSMAEMSEELNDFYKKLFPSLELKNTFGEVISNAGLTQLRIAETEKYAHVTFFFNGGEETKFKGEDRVLIKSPDVTTYDLKPEMSANEVCDKVVLDIENKKHDVIILNFANPDMVGHTGILDAAIKAVETVDNCIGRLEQAVLNSDGEMLVVADHGNAEIMYDAKKDKPHTAHTTNPVPFILIGNDVKNIELRNGKLSNAAPTMLKLLGVDKPKEMTEDSLF